MEMALEWARFLTGASGFVLQCIVIVQISV